MAKKRTNSEARDENAAKLEAFGIDRIADMMRDGAVYRDVAHAAGVALATLWRWVHGDEERMAKVNAALKDSADAADAMAEQVLREIPDNATKAMVARARELAQHYRWRASKRNPKTYGERQQLDLDGSLDVNMTEEQVDAQLVAILAKAAKRTAS